MCIERDYRLISLSINYSKLRRSIVVLFVLLLSLPVFAADPCEGRADISTGPALRWWKGNLHTHTLWSDGKDYPEMIVDWYKKHGYHFLSLSDHNILSQGQKWLPMTHKRATKEALSKYLDRFGENWVEQRTVDGVLEIRLKPLTEFRCFFEEPKRFLLIQGDEITEKLVHINAINLLEVIARRGGRTPEHVIRNDVNAVLEQSERTGQMMFAFVNHPNFKWLLTAKDIFSVEQVKFFEVYNCAPGVHNHGDRFHASAERMWDIILTKRLAELNFPVVYGFATDDAHIYHKWGPEHANPGRGWVVVRARHLTPESIIKAMDAGDFYASTGVVLKDIQLDGKTFKIVIEPEKGVSYTTQFIGTMRGYDPTSKPVLDEEGKNIRTTRIYSDDIGKVLAEVKGTVASYTLTGNEIYVRAKIISTKLRQNAPVEGKFEAGWTQPILPNCK